MRAVLTALVCLGLAASASAQINVAPGSLMPPVVAFPSSAVDSSGTIRKALLFAPDATFDIGANGATRPANVWVSGQINASTVSIFAAAGGKFAWGNGNAFVSGATATISSGFGTTPGITGTASVFRVTLGNPVAQAGVVLFNASPAFGSAPFVSCRDEITQTANPATYAVTATQVTITFTTAVAGDTVVCSVQGLP